MREKTLNVFKIVFSIILFIIGCVSAYSTFKMKNLVHYGEVKTDFRSEITAWGDHPIQIAGAGGGGGVDSSNDGVAIGLGIFSGLSILSSAYLVAQLQSKENK